MYAIGWTKLFGTGLVSLALPSLLPSLYPWRAGFNDMYALAIIEFLLDVIYVGILTRRRWTLTAVPPRVATLRA
ncbi:MAG: hypothetical protein JO057_05180, partial [Chloroflexi bacterium]|nr:hypothetical protein [Chloroflexota bacterium]